MHDAAAAFAHTPFRGNDDAGRLADSEHMAHRTFFATEAHATQWLHRLHVHLRWARADFRQTNHLPLLRLAGAVLLALLALATASGLITPS
jgi:hypothetical protein